jgi:membrane associated rhomboid family serine protease/predicted RNA-binding Zn-ribbon protein involved in translation (DUF1610 family)
MFILLPWKVDVPQDRWPATNWLIIVAAVAVYVLQVADNLEFRARVEALRPALQQQGPNTPGTARRPVDPNVLQRIGPPPITYRLMLRGWSLKGLFGYMWLHGGVLHLAGNMLFLWIFGNAVCAKIGNVKFLLLYIFFGLCAGIAHLLFTGSPVLGASGAINGVVGLYLVLFYENEVTCLFAFWFILPYVRWFTVSSIWIILLSQAWNVLGAFVCGGGGQHVAYFAHLGGFAAGFGTGMLMCKMGWITMERYERSLWQMWEQRKQKQEQKEHALDADLVRLGLRAADIETPPVAAVPKRKSTPLPPLEPEATQRDPLSDAFVRTACACGKSIKVARQYVGRAVRCPHCGRSVVIPSQSDSFGTPLAPTTTKRDPAAARDGFIRLVCPCGKKLKVPAHYAGRSGKCPQCGAHLRIPPPLA